MTKLLCSLVAVLTLTSALGNQITFSGSNGLGDHQSGQGGAFTVKPDAGLSWVLPYYSPLAQNVGGTSGTFQTFCLEKTEQVYANTTYDVVLNSKTQFGGVPLSKGAAYIYFHFATGNLADYNYGTGVGAAELQQTIWWLMGQSSFVSNPFSQAVVTTLGLDALVANDGAYPVQVMNLWGVGHTEQQGYSAQDQLVLTGHMVPDPAVTFLLLSLSFSMSLIARKYIFGI